MTVKKLALAALCSVHLLNGCNDTGQSEKDFQAEIRKPNYVTIVIDDMGFSDLPFFGGEAMTPNLNQLAESGTILDHFYAAATSTPSRGMLFTGKDNHPAGTGNMAGWLPSHPEQQGQPGYEGILSLDVLPIPQVLQDNGYYTMMVGKWDLGEEPGYYPIDRGFDQSFVLLPGGDTHYLADENGAVLTSHQPSKYAALGRTSLYNRNGQEVTAFPPYAYAASYYTDMAIEMLEQRPPEQPFYLTLCHIAPHAPLQAPQAVIAKYLARYQAGWDILRQVRFERMKAMGLFSNDAVLPPRPAEVPAWDSLSVAEQTTEIKRMAIYAAMLEILDQNVGRLINHLKLIGEYESTVFVVYSDNGAEYKAAGRAPGRTPYLAANFTGDEDYENMGAPTSYITQSIGWGWYSNTPFRRYKRDTYEGGVHTSAFVLYPKGILPGGKRSQRLTSVMDIGATFLDMAGISYPDTFQGRPNPPLQGISMAGLLTGNEMVLPNRWLAWELDGVKGVRQGNWKLAQQRKEGAGCWYDDWHLFNLALDPFEQHDLAAFEPRKLQELLRIYEGYAAENGVIALAPCP